MKFLLITLTLTSGVVDANQEGKVPSSIYFRCFIERAAEFDPGRNFKEDFYFPFPLGPKETKEITGSLRWNGWKLKFQRDGKVEILISEQIKGKNVVSELRHDLGKNPEFKSLKVKLEVKGEGVIVPYNVSCGPE